MASIINDCIQPGVKVSVNGTCVDLSGAIEYAQKFIVSTNDTFGYFKKCCESLTARVDKLSPTIYYSSNPVIYYQTSTKIIYVHPKLLPILPSSTIYTNPMRSALRGIQPPYQGYLHIDISVQHPTYKEKMGTQPIITRDNSGIDKVEYIDKRGRKQTYWKISY